MIGHIKLHCNDTPSLYLTRDSKGCRNQVGQRLVIHSDGVFRNAIVSLVRLVDGVFSIGQHKQVIGAFLHLRQDHTAVEGTGTLSREVQHMGLR